MKKFARGLTVATILSGQTAFAENASYINEDGQFTNSSLAELTQCIEGELEEVFADANRILITEDSTGGNAMSFPNFGITIETRDSQSRGYTNGTFQIFANPHESSPYSLIIKSLSSDVQYKASLDKDTDYFSLTRQFEELKTAIPNLDVDGSSVVLGSDYVDDLAGSVSASSVGDKVAKENVVHTMMAISNCLQ